MSIELQHSTLELVWCDCMLQVSQPVFSTVLRWIYDGELEDTYHEVSGARLCATRYLSETHLIPKSVEIWFAHSLFLNYLIILKFCTEHGSFTALLCAKFQNDLTTEMDVMDERDFARFEFKMSFGWISYIAHISEYHCNGGAVYNIRIKSLAPIKFYITNFQANLVINGWSISFPNMNVTRLYWW